MPILLIFLALAGAGVVIYKARQLPAAGPVVNNSRAGDGVRVKPKVQRPAGQLAPLNPLKEVELSPPGVPVASNSAGQALAYERGGVQGPGRRTINGTAFIQSRIGLMARQRDARNELRPKTVFDSALAAGRPPVRAQMNGASFMLARRHAGQPGTVRPESTYNTGAVATIDPNENNGASIR